MSCNSVVYNGIERCKKQRNSSIELFRIIATFFVLIIHLYGWMAGGLVDWNDENISSLQKISQLIIQSLTIVCVNCFLIISGWYGIKFKFSSIWRLWTIVFFIYFPFQILEYISVGTFSIGNLIDNILVFTRESYFVQCYSMLLFLSPVINSFFDKYGKKGLNYIIAFWIIEIIMEAIWDNKSLGFEDGYSLIHFILIYMMARMASLYKDQILQIKRIYWIFGYFICAFIICICHLLKYSHTWDYSNPIVVVESFCLFFPFLYKCYYNKWVNWIASSTLAVFIMHTCSPLYTMLVNIDNYLLINYKYFTYLLFCFLLIVVTFCVCVLYDKARIRLFQPLTDILYEKINKVFCIWIKNFL